MLAPAALPSGRDPERETGWAVGRLRILLDGQEATLLERAALMVSAGPQLVSAEPLEEPQWLLQVAQASRGGEERPARSAPRVQRRQNQCGELLLPDE